MQRLELTQSENIYSVSQLNSETRALLEGTFQAVWVEGEISNFAAPHSGHWYFSLKDANAQVRCAMFRANQRRLDFLPKDGNHVLIRARVSLYENRGEFQLIVDHIEERGEGKLRRAFEALKKKLDAAGLFAKEHKKPLPAFPRHIGVITSATGAAIRDVLTVLKRRYACAPVIIYPSLVQGESAAASLVKAIDIANRRKECDILILTRGGGSLEDLWPFNEESVAHAIYHSEIPIISGVGHEVDFTIADFVADIRAPTPSAAAEMVTRDCGELIALLTKDEQRLLRCVHRALNATKERIAWTQKHLSQQHPRKQLSEKMQHLDFCELTLLQLQTRLLNRLQLNLKEKITQLQSLLPQQRIESLKSQTQFVQQRIQHLMLNTMNENKATLMTASARLNALSPLATLGRGFAIATKEGHLLRDTQHIQNGDSIQVRLMKGQIDCIVKEVS